MRISDWSSDVCSSDLDGDGRPADAGAEVGDAATVELLVEAGHRGQPRLDEVVGEGGTVDPALPVAELGAIALVGHASAGAVCGRPPLEHAGHAPHHRPERRALVPLDQVAPGTAGPGGQRAPRDDP